VAGGLVGGGGGNGGGEGSGGATGGVPGGVTGGAARATWYGGGEGDGEASMPGPGGMRRDMYQQRRKKANKPYGSPTMTERTVPCTAVPRTLRRIGTSRWPACTWTVAKVHNI